VSKRAPFPLQWPDGWKRTRWRNGSRFGTGGFNAARDGVIHGLELMGASHVVITSNLPTNSKGLPHSTSAGRLDDPGIAVWWVQAGKERVMACDRWLTARENMHAIELSVAAMRGLDRWGCTEVVERAFAGFAALPPGSSNGTHASPQAPKTWREIFGVTAFETLGPADLLAIVKSRYRKMISEVHPDTGGDHTSAAELNIAISAAEKELTA
jgi:hypothetical protein